MPSVAENRCQTSTVRQLSRRCTGIFADFEGLCGAQQPSHRLEFLVELKNSNEALHAKLHADIYHEVALGQLSEVKISTLLNVNRERYGSNQSLLASLADVLLNAESSADYESIPVSN